jgi:hypothetical protein
MGIAYRHDEPHSISVSVWTGEVNLKQALRHVAKIAADPEWGASDRILSDLTGMDSSALPSRDQVAALAAAFSEQLDGRTRPARWAVVASSAFAEASQFGRAIDEDVRSVMVFFDLASACTWLRSDYQAVHRIIASLRVEAGRTAAWHESARRE